MLHYLCVEAGSPSSCFVSLLSSLCALGYLLNLRQQKARYIAVTGFYNLKPGNVVVPTAVESHIANAANSLLSGEFYDFSVGSRCARPTYVMVVAVSGC